MKHGHGWLLLIALILIAGPVFAGTAGEAVTATPSKSTAPQPSPEDELDIQVWSQDWEDDDTWDEWSGFDPVLQDHYWQVDDWMPYEGNGSWRCFDPDFGHPEYGGYNDDWLQLLMTPALDVSAYNALELSFMFRMNAEEPDWDGGNVWVAYGNSPGQWEAQEIVTPTTPAYTETDMNAFDIWFGAPPMYPGWSGRNGLGFDDYTEAIFDLSTYAQNYDYVQIAFIFATDHNINTVDYPQMFGWQLDNIEVIADGTDTVWADDADGTNIGGDPILLAGIEALPDGPVDMAWEIMDVGGDAYSGTHVLGITEVPFRRAFDHFYEGPEFDLEPLGDGEDYYINCYYNSEFEELPNPDVEDVCWWRVEVYIPDDQQWVAASRVDGTNNYVYTQQTGGTWMNHADSYATRWDCNTLAGESGIRLRAAWHNPDEEYDFSYFYMDDLWVEKEALAYDVGTMLFLPYPTTVGTPVYGKAYYTNNAGNVAEGVLPTWALGGIPMPMFPSGTITVPIDATVERSIDVPTDDVDGYWVPTVDDLAVNTVSATANFGQDEVPDNNTDVAETNIQPDGYFEVGADTRSFYGLLSVHNENEGPVVHVDPVAVNAPVFSQFDDYDIMSMEVRAFMWDDGTTGGAQANHQLRMIIYEGGATPGAVLWSDLVDVVQLDGSPMPEGYSGDCKAVADLSDVAEVQDLTGSFYLAVELTMQDMNGVEWQPLISRTTAHEPWQQYQFQDLDAANSGNSNDDFGHHISVILDGTDVSVEEPANGNRPGRYALEAAYPNPFNPTTNVQFAMAMPGEVQVSVYNSLGQEVASLVDGERAAGRHTVTLDGRTLASGVYLIQMRTATFSATRKVVLMK